MLAGPGRQRSRPAFHIDGPGGHSRDVRGLCCDTIALELRWLIPSGLPEIPKVEVESLSFRFFSQDAKI